MPRFWRCSSTLDGDCGITSRNKDMDKDRVEGAAHEAKGAVKEAFGKLSGDAKIQAEGAAEKAAGKVQNAIGGAKDVIRDATK